MRNEDVSLQDGEQRPESRRLPVTRGSESSPSLLADGDLRLRSSSGLADLLLSLLDALDPDLERAGEADAERERERDCEGELEREADLDLDDMAAASLT